MSDNTNTIELEYCPNHNFGPVTKNSQRQKEHIKNSDGECGFVKYDPKKHNPKYRESEIQHNDGTEEKLTDSQKVLNFVLNHICKKVRGYGNHSNVYVMIKINGNYKVLFLGSNECIQWLKSAYYDHSGKVHSNDLYKNALSLITAQSITNEITIEKIYTRIAIVNGDIFYNLCDGDYQLVHITKDGYSITKTGLDNPMFRRKSSPLSQPIPKKPKDRNPLQELVDLLRIPQENKQLFKVHLISLFIEHYPIPIMILHGEAGSAKSTITATVKKIVDPSPENRNSLPESIDDLNIHVFNRYLSNFDNISFIPHKTSDECCKIITGHAHNKRELYTDDGEIILTVKGRILLNGVTPNVEYTDLMDRSIFYESKFLPENERLTDEEFDKKLDELIPYLLDQIFQTLSDMLKNIESVKPEIKFKKRMADFTVYGECISRSLGYEKFSFIEAYQNNLNSNSLRAYESWPIINVVLDIIRTKGRDFEISVDELYQKCKIIAFEKSLDTKSQFSKFPKNESALSGQLTRLSGSFRNSGYNITSYRYNSRDGKFKRGTRIIKISSTMQPSFLSLSENGKPPVSPVSVCHDDNQSQNHSKTDTGSKNDGCVTCVKDKDPNSDTSLTQTVNSKPVSINDKSLPENGTDTLTPLTQGISQPLEGDDEKPEKSVEYFKCAQCHFGDYIRIDSKSRISDDTLYDIHKRKHPTHKLEYSDGGKSS